MNEPVHMAITRRIREECVGEFERELIAFASRSLTDTHSRGVHLLYPTPGSGSTEYGIMRSFANVADRDAFYASDFYKEWSASVEHMQIEGPKYRVLEGLEAWFREPHAKMPPRWKMAVVTWLAVWPVSMIVAALVLPLLGSNVHHVLRGGIVSAGIVVVLTWVAMPFFVKLAHGWLHPKSNPIKKS